MQIKRKHLIMHISLFLGLILLSLLSMSAINNLYKVPHVEKKIVFDQNLIIDNPLSTPITNSIPFNILFSHYKEIELKPILITTSFELKDIAFNNPALVIPVMEGNAVQVFLNGIDIGQSGDIRFGQSSRWNHAEYFSFPSDYLKPGINTLTLKVTTLSSIGFVEPYYIAEDQVGKRHVFILNTLNNSIILISIGFLILLGIIFLSIGFYIDRNWGRVFIGTSLLLLSLYFSDYYFIEVIALPFAVFKKIVMASFYISLGFLSMGYAREYKAKHKWPSDVIAGLLFLSGLTMLLLPPDTIIIKNIYYKINMLIILFLINTLILVFKNFLFRRDGYSAVQFYVFGFIIPLIAHDLIGLFLAADIVLFAPQAIVIFYLLTAATISFSFIDVHKQMINHRKKAVLEKNKNFIDELTKVFDRKIMHQIRDLIPLHFAVVLIDINDLEHFNKKYGYYTGDYILSTFAYLLKNTTRAADYIIRYSEDSFLMLLVECNLSTATQIVTEFKKTVSTHQFVLEGYKISDEISFSAAVIGKERYDTTHDLMLQAENLLLEAKKEGKGSIKFDDGF